VLRLAVFPIHHVADPEPADEPLVFRNRHVIFFYHLGRLAPLTWHSMTQVQIDIRPFVADDAMTWRTIRLEALANAPEAFGQTLEHAEKQPIEAYRQTVSGPFPPFAAFDGAKAVGTAGFYILGGPKMSHRGVLWGMYVSPTHRSQGIGRKLIGSVINHARERVEQIHLHVVTTNTAAYNLYRSMGFVAYGIEPRALRHAGRDYDEAMMVLMIEPL
jgi:ribosomal protein S18 acetylase RimI-like enzyme